jgi:hypothetical protein
MSNLELVRDLVFVRVTIFLQQTLVGSNESLLDIRSKWEGEDCLSLKPSSYGFKRLDWILLSICPKERETAI